MVTRQQLHELYEAERARLGALTDAAPGMYESPVFGEGPETPFLLLVGEAPGGEEAMSGRPFVGKAGKQLDMLLALAGIPRDCVYITNAVKFRPVAYSSKGGMRNRTPGKDEIKASLALLQNEMRLLRPGVVATLGNIPLFSVLALCEHKPLTIGQAHGAPVSLALQDARFSLFPLYHPASTIYNRALTPVCEADACRLGDLYRAGLKTEVL